MQKKTKCRKKYMLEAKEVADVANVSESYVKQVRTADSSGVSLSGEKAKIIKAIDIASAQNKSLFIQKLKQIVNI